MRKILGPRLHGAYIEDPYAVDQSLYIAISPTDDVAQLKFVLGILLSKLGAWYLRTKYAIYDTLYPWYTKKQLASFPIRKKDDKLVALVDQMMATKEQEERSFTDSDRTHYKNKCDALDDQIDRLVFELYDITETEQKVITGR